LRHSPPGSTDQEVQRRRRREGRHEGHDDHHRVELRRDQAQVQAEVEHDQLHPAARVQQQPERELRAVRTDSFP
jgi:hypothetical protein